MGQHYDDDDDDDYRYLPSPKHLSPPPVQWSRSSRSARKDARQDKSNHVVPLPARRTAYLISTPHPRSAVAVAITATRFHWSMNSAAAAGLISVRRRGANAHVDPHSLINAQYMIWRITTVINYD
jgi:hypothetical protein